MNCLGQHAVVQVRVSGQVFAARDVCPLWYVRNSKFQVWLRRPCLFNETRDAGERHDGSAHAPTEIIKPQLDQAQIWLVGGHSFGDEVLGYVRLLSACSEVVTVGEKVRMDSGSVTSIGAEGCWQLERLVFQSRWVWRMGFIWRDGAVVGSHKAHVDAFLAKPLPDSVSPSPIALSSMRNRVAHHHHLDCRIFLIFGVGGHGWR